MCFLFSSSLILQCWRRRECITMVDRACIVVDYLPEKCNPVNFQTPIYPCLSGSRVWNRFFVNTGYGWKGLSAQNSSAHLTVLIAAADVHCLFSLTSTNQHSQLQELIKSHSHLCDFYLKYHCKLNFIEQYWGCSEGSIPHGPSSKNTSANGGHYQGKPWQCSPSPELSVILFIPLLFFLFVFHKSLAHLGLLIVLHVSFQLTESTNLCWVISLIKTMMTSSLFKIDCMNTKPFSSSPWHIRWKSLSIPGHMLMSWSYHTKIGLMDALHFLIGTPESLGSTTLWCKRRQMEG